MCLLCIFYLMLVFNRETMIFKCIAINTQRMARKSRLFEVYALIYDFTFKGIRRLRSLTMHVSNILNTVIHLSRFRRYSP